jgi:hypothetical protein
MQRDNAVALPSEWWRTIPRPLVDCEGILDTDRHRDGPRGGSSSSPDALCAENLFLGKGFPWWDRTPAY